MAQTPNTWDDYVGNGVEDTFQVTFPYHKEQEVFVTVDDAPTAFTFISAGWIQLAAVPASGAAIRVSRSTEAFAPRHEFANGVPLLPRFIDENNKQFLYVVQEVVNETPVVAAEARDVAEEARDVAEEARDVAEGAMGIAQAASDKVDAAVIESAYQLRLDLADSTDPAKGAEMVGYKGHTVAQKLDDLGTAATATLTSSADDYTQGRVLKVGDGGLFTAAVKTPNTDWNNATIPGVIYNAEDALNAPGPGWFFGRFEKHHSHGTQYAAQFVIEVPMLYVRNIVADIWGPWVQLYHTGNISTASVAYAAKAGYAAMAGNAVTAGHASRAGNAIGVGQTWRDVTASRALNTIYTNTTGRSIQLLVDVRDAEVPGGLTFNINGIEWSVHDVYGGSGSPYLVSPVIPADNKYSLGASSGVNIHRWLELR